jgi:flagellar biosynthetic protein FlhB
MAEGADQEDRTEAATPRRLQRARDEGRMPLSREVPLFAGLAAATIALAVFAPTAGRDTVAAFARLLGGIGGIDFDRDGLSAIRLALLAGLRLAAPFVLTVLVCGVASVLLQTGAALNPAALRPDLGRLNPLAGLRRLLGLDALVETGKSLVKLSVLVAVLWNVLSGALGMLLRAPMIAPTAVPGEATRLVVRVLLAVLAVQAVIAGADVVWVRLRHARSLRMSRHEIREELKETDGDPRVKQRLRQIRMQRARKRMLAAVPKATVVVTNPTHFAVALAYDRATSGAPRLVAKGVDSMAARIREIAAAHRVPVVANPPLARALYRVELDAEIPPEHYQAVAEIVAYVWGLNRRAGRPAT